MIARVRGEIARSTSFGSMFKVSGSISTITGLSPHCTTGQIVVDHDSAGTITSSPGFNRSGIAGLTMAAIARRLADEPELFMMACLKPKASAYSRSNPLTFGPMVTFVDSSTSTAALISSAENVGSWSRTTGAFGLKRKSWFAAQ